MKASLVEVLHSLRWRLEPAFSRDTASPGTDWHCPSAGHCAAAAVIVHDRLGGDFLSARVNDQSHWFNRVVDGLGVYHVDITGDQFGRAPVQAMFTMDGELYAGTRGRLESELTPETVARARILAARMRS